MSDSSDYESESYEENVEEDQEPSIEESNQEEVENEEIGEDEAKRLEDEEKQIKELLKHTSYETLLRLRKEDNRISPFSKKIQKEKITLKPGTGQAAKKPKSKSKTTPKERDARVPISRFQTVVEPKKHKGRDPRFDGMSGVLNQDLFKKSYNFLIEQKHKEIQSLQKELKAPKKKYSPDEIVKLREALGKNKEEMNRFKQNEEIISAKKELKKPANKAGKVKKPFFVKKSELKAKVLEKKFEDLSKKKKLNKTMDEKKKRQSQKLLYEFKKLQKNANIRKQREAAAAQK